MLALKKSEERFDSETYELKAQIAALTTAIESDRQKRSDELKKIEGAKSLRNFIWLSVLLILPYPIVLAFIWYLLNKFVSTQWIVYGIVGLLTVFISITVINLLIKIGSRDEFISNNETFINWTSKLRWKAVFSFFISIAWLIVSKLIEEFAVKKVFP